MRKRVTRSVVLFLLLLTYQVSAQGEVDWEPVYWGIVEGDTVWDFFSGGIGGNYPALVDIDNDNDLDLFLGRNAAINYYQNVGTPETPEWKFITPYYNIIKGHPYSGEGGNTDNLPIFVDLDGDGDYDKFVLGDSDGPEFYYYCNDGTPEEPQWTLVTEEYDGFHLPDPGPSSYIRWEGLTFVDIDADGDYDAVMTYYIGPFGGLHLAYFRNDGDATSPDWILLEDDYLPGAIEPYLPSFVDIDGDRDYDLLFDGGIGYIYFYRNEGDSVNAHFVFVTDDFNSLGGGLEHHEYWGRIPCFGDLDADGDYDLVMTSVADQILSFYENVGRADSAHYVYGYDITTCIDVMYFTNLALVDIDWDGDSDIIFPQSTLALSDRLLLLRNDGDSTSPNWTFVGDFTGHVNISNPSFVDIDSDGDYDLFGGGWWDSKLYFYRNEGTLEEPYFVLVTDQYIQGSWWWFAPAFADIDADGDYDLFVGGDGGAIAFFRNDGDAFEPEWTLVTDFFESIDVGWDSQPYFVDIDEDGDYDLFVCEGGWTISYFRNDGDSANPLFSFVADNYLGTTERNEGIDFVDIDSDGDFDLFTGDTKGGIRFYRNPGCSESIGDVNGDGSIDILDVVRIINIILENPPPPAACELKASDANNDGKVNILDVVAVVNMILDES